MGSCENLTSVDESSCDSVFDRHLCLEFNEEPVSEQRLCTETSFDVVDANVSGSERLDECLGLCGNDAMHCVASLDVGDTGINNEYGLTSESQNVVGVGLKKVLDDECGVHRVCFNESQGEVAVCNSLDSCLGLSQDGKNICVSSANDTEAVSGDKDGSVGDCENGTCSVLEKLENDKQGVCLNESQSEVSVCFGETNVLSSEKIGFQGKDLASFENQNLALGEMPNNSSLRFCYQHDKQKNDQEVNPSYVEETAGVMEEETNLLAEVKVGNDHHTLSSDAFGMSLELIPVTRFPINCVQQHRQKGDNIVSRLSGEEGIMIEKSDALTEWEKDPCGQTVPPQSFEILSDLKPMTGLPCSCAQINEQKEEMIVSCPSTDGDIKGMEEKTDALGSMEKVSRDQILTSQVCERPSESLPLTGSPRNSVQQDDRENDNSVGCSSSKEVVEGIDEKTGASNGMVEVSCDLILPSQCCEMSSDHVSLVGSPRNCVLLGERENDKNNCSPTAEDLQEVIEEKMGICGLLSHGSSMSSEFTPMTNSLGNCSKQNVQKGNEGISISSLEEVVEGKNYSLPGVQIDICTHMLSLQECEFPSQSIPVDKKEFIMKKKIGFVGKIEHDICHPRSPTEHIEFSTELASSAGFSSSSALQNEQKGIESIQYAAVEGKADTSVAVEANFCNCISAVQDGEVPFKISCKDDLMRTCERHKSQTDHESVRLLTVGTIKPKGNTDACILSLPMQSCQSSLESSHVAVTLRKPSPQNEQRNNRSVNCLSAESDSEAVEDISDVTTDAKVEVCSQLLPLEEIIKEQSSRVAPNSFIEKKSSMQSCQPSIVGMNGPCKSLDITDFSQKDGFGPISSSSAVHGFGPMGIEGKDDARANCFSETIYPNIISSFSRMSKISRSSQRTQTKRAKRNCRTTAKVQYSRGSINIIFNVARRRRSCLFRPARSSMWGLLGNITQIFGNSDVSSFSSAQNQGSQKARGGNGSQKKNKIRAGGSSSRSSRKFNVSTRCIRLKVKVGKEICQSTLNVVVPEVVDTTVSDDIIIDDDRTDTCHTKNSQFPQLAHEVEDTLGEEGTERRFQCPLANQDLKATVIVDQSAGDVADDNPAHKVVEVLGGAIGNNYLEPGTSPDSEVINLGPDAEFESESQEGGHKIAFTSSDTLAAPGNVNSGRRGKKTNILFSGNPSPEDSSTVAASMSKAKPPKKRGGRQKLEDVSQSGDCLSAFLGVNPPSHSSSGEPLPSSGEAEPGTLGENMVPSIKSKGCAPSKNLKSDGREIGQSKVSNSTKSRRKNPSAQQGNQRKSVNKKKIKNSVLEAKRRDKVIIGWVEYKAEDQPQIGSHIADDIEKNDSGNSSVSIDVANVEITSAGEPEHKCDPESAWVQCDDCYKWRRIPVSLANSIDENCRWVCKDNMDTTFADCSSPQEKTNADINAELGLSDYEEEAGFLNYNRSVKGLDSQNIAALPGSSFRRIDSNVFLHRNRKTQTIDEVMVCHCKPPLDGRLGCGDECLNRMLNIECVQGTCPCGDLCSNQQFQKRKYAKMQWRPCGKKGYGLELLEHIPKGKFIIEYVGEVLDMQAYEARQKDYAANGHKHFYFMTLNGSEVIDACAKGNLGRFINHSCDPNCRTEKWMVNGEICIGLFAMRDIKEAEELTFDYNYVRVFGAAAKKCHCGSHQCRGYIGGDPLNNEIIYQGDSDDESPEPVMLEDGETGRGSKTISGTSSLYGDRTQISEAIAKDTSKMDDSSRAGGQLEMKGKVGNIMNQSTPAISIIDCSVEIEDSKGKDPSPQSLETSLQVEDETSMLISPTHQEVSKEEAIMKTSSEIPQVENSSPAMISGKLFPDGSDANKKSKSDIVKDNQGSLKSRPRIKTSRQSATVKKGKVNVSPLNGNKDKLLISKSQVLPFKPKKIMEGSSNGRFEAVQEKLNELLDAEGGISKRKDAPKGYLKLLLLTVASGGSGNGDFIQSNRDLSMILDALLKTKSRMVLMDIISKNGLQMLHNMIKQYRGDFKKIPILRKLLKVLEYLAVREILTQNQITAGPPCPGMESFRGSILSLTEHDDKQVHQIARSFRDRWIPKPFRKHSNMDRDGGGMDVPRGANCTRLPMLHNHRSDQGLRPSEAIDCVMQSLVATTSVDVAANEAGPLPGTGGSQTGGSKTRKRKSRWDQPAKANLDSTKQKELKLESGVSQSREDINCPDQSRSHCNKDEVSHEDGQTIQEDVPPGFSSPFNPPLVSSDASSTTDLPQQSVSHIGCAFDVAIAQPQRKFNSRLPVSYGIPLHILQQFGSPFSETVDGWVIAPGMPFQPFPPLPLLPRDKKETQLACAVSCKMVNGPSEVWKLDSNHPSSCGPNEDNPSTTGANQSDADIPGTDTQHTFKRMRDPSNDLGKKYFRQQKRKVPPWLWRTLEHRNSYCPQDVSCREDKAVSNFHQRPPHQNHH